MKYTIITALALIVSVAALGQKPKLTPMPDCVTSKLLFGQYPCKVPHFEKGHKYYTVNDLHGFYTNNTSIRGLGTIKPAGLFVWGTQQQQPFLSIDSPTNGWNNQIDSIIMHVNKSQLHWLNDSTVVIHKK